MPPDMIVLDALDRVHIAIEWLMMGVWANAIISLGVFIHNVRSRRGR